MRSWMLLAAPLLLAACSGARITQTSANPRGIQFLVQNARFVAAGDVEDRASRHCEEYGLLSRRAQSERIDDSSMTVRFECVGPRKTASKTADRKPADVQVAVPEARVVRSQNDRKQAAWDQANAMSRDWVKCIFDGATQIARLSNDNADVAAVSVVGRCAQWEHDVHEVLREAGEDDGDFQTALHRQLIDSAAARIVAVRGAPSDDRPRPPAASQSRRSGDQTPS